MFTRVGADTELVMIIIVGIRLVEYAIDNKDRWRRLMFLLVLALVAAAAWWLLGGGGLPVLLHDFGPAPTGVPGSPAP